MQCMFCALDLGFDSLVTYFWQQIFLMSDAGEDLSSNLCKLQPMARFHLVNVFMFVMDSLRAFWFAMFKVFS